MCAHTHACVCAALCSRGRKSQDDGDFKTRLTAGEEACHCIFFFSPPPTPLSNCTFFLLLFLFSSSPLTTVNTFCMHPWSMETHGSMHELPASVCDQLYEQKNFSNKSCSGWFSSGGTHAVCNMTARARGRACRQPQKGSEKKSRRGEGERARVGGDSVGSGNSTPSDGCNWQTPEHRGMLGQQQTLKWKNTTKARGIVKRKRGNYYS